MDVNNKSIVITGAAGGLGQSMATALSRRGAKVTLIDVEDLSTTLNNCRMQNGEVRAYRCDITNEFDVNETFQAIVDQYGAIDVLINNAGILRDGLLIKEQSGDVQPLDYEQFKAVIDVNINGSFLCGRAAAAHMYRTGREGVIINMSSVSRAGNFGQTSYSASKAAVAAMTVVWAKELGRYGIRVAAIAPGVVQTPMTASMPPEALERITSMVPVGRIATPEQVVDAINFILKNSYFNGRVLELDGGLRL